MSEADRIRARWGDMLRIAGSLTLGEVGDYDLIRMLSRDGKPTAGSRNGVDKSVSGAV